MRGYSRFRVILLSGLLLLAIGMVSSSSFGQATQPAGTAPPPAKAGLMQLILSHPDPVFFTIAGVSVAGLALIINGFIKTWPSVFMPETSTNAIREMIAGRRYQELIDFTETDPSFV